MTLVDIVHHYIWILTPFHILVCRIYFYILLLYPRLFFQTNDLFMPLQQLLPCFMSVLYVPVPLHFLNFFFVHYVLQDELASILIFVQSLLLNQCFQLISGVHVNPWPMPKLWSLFNHMLVRVFQRAITASFLGQVLSDHPCVEAAIHFSVEYGFILFNAPLVRFKLNHFPLNLSAP